MYVLTSDIFQILCFHGYSPIHSQTLNKLCKLQSNLLHTFRSKITQLSSLLLFVSKVTSAQHPNHIMQWRQHPTCGRHYILRAFTAKLWQKTCFAGTSEAYANQIIFRSWWWWSFAAKCPKTLLGKKKNTKRRRYFFANISLTRFLKSCLKLKGAGQKRIIIQTYCFANMSS